MGKVNQLWQDEQERQEQFNELLSTLQLNASRLELLASMKTSQDMFRARGIKLTVQQLRQTADAIEDIPYAKT